MAIITTCCCCFNIRTGSIITGIYTTVLAGIYVLITISSLVANSSSEAGVLIPLVIQLLLYVGLLIVSIILIYAALKDNGGLFIPWLVMMPIYIILQLISIIILIFFVGIGSWVAVLNIILFILFTIFNIYCYLCVLSQYQELRAGRGTVEYYRQLSAAQGRPVVVTTTTSSTQKA
ncbi:lysosomal-associated transmembrane protein 4A-like [Ptychodera flava]|uniref:lysosomal-associated transmembrane protein 4A-like n=1 Tax=Ptychodera flava TaxID=63121 RepID=UPI00396AA201